jgi:hypothetical protein
MSILHPSRTTRRLLPRRLIQLASLGLAGLLAGLLAGCSSIQTGSPAGALLPGHLDTDWDTIPTYASATAEMAPGSISRTAHIRPCYASPCRSGVAAPHLHPTHHHI